MYVTLNFIRGLGFGWIFFNSLAEAMVVAGIMAISSSAIITKLLVELKRAANPETELILGIMVFEDVFIAVYLSILTGIIISGGFISGQLIINIILIIGFVLSVIIFGPRLGAFLDGRLKFNNAETFIVAIFTMLLLTGIMMEKIHIAEAIGALLLGLVIAETSHNHRIVQAITPMRDLFGSVFFFTFGMAINYRSFYEVAAISAAAVIVTVLGNIITGYLASWFSGYKKRRAANIAFTIMARGEFSIIVASLAATNGLNASLPAFAALYVFSLAFIAPVLARNTKTFSILFERAKNYFSGEFSSSGPPK